MKFEGIHLPARAACGEIWPESVVEGIAPMLFAARNGLIGVNVRFYQRLYNCIR